MKRLFVIVVAGVLALSLCGCFALIAGTAGGAGTAAWLSGKLTQEFNAPYEKTIRAAESALKSFKLTVKKKTHEETVTQLISEYTDGKDIWIDVRKISEASTKVEVRVGAVSPNKEAAAKILAKIQAYL